MIKLDMMVVDSSASLSEKYLKSIAAEGWKLVSETISASYHARSVFVREVIWNETVMMEVFSDGNLKVYTPANPQGWYQDRSLYVTLMDLGGQGFTVRTSTYDPGADVTTYVLTR